MARYSKQQTRAQHNALTPVKTEAGILETNETEVFGMYGRCSEARASNVTNKHDSANVSHRRFYLTDARASGHGDNRSEVETRAGRLRAECGGAASTCNSAAGMVLTAPSWPRVYFSRWHFAAASRVPSLPV